MDCNCNHWSAGSCRPQMPPPCMNTNCGCGSPMPMPPIQPRMAEPPCSMPSCGKKPSCGGKPPYGGTPPAPLTPPCGCQPMKAPHTTDSCNMPIAMAYVPWQQWRQTYPMDKALSRGTIFPELDMPFVMGRCR